MLLYFQADAPVLKRLNFSRAFTAFLISGMRIAQIMLRRPEIKSGDRVVMMENRSAFFDISNTLKSLRMSIPLEAMGRLLPTIDGANTPAIDLPCRLHVLSGYKSVPLRLRAVRYLEAFGIPIASLILAFCGGEKWQSIQGIASATNSRFPEVDCI